MATIAHFDADAFFASVEQAADRRLRGRPIAVGGTTRGVVCSASYEARRYGIHSAMPTRRALQLCPELTVVRGQFELYERFSGQIFDLCEDLTPRVERTSIDEGYIDLRERTGALGEAIRLMRQFDQEIHRWMKITVSCGLAAQKRVAQIAGKAGKPHGFTVVPPGSEAAFLAPLPLRHLPGIGPVAGQRLNALGLQTVGQLVQSGADVLYPVLGKRAAGLLCVARGEDEEPVLEVSAPAQSFSGQETFATECGSEAAALKEGEGLLGRQLARLRAAGKSARTVSLGIRYTDQTHAQASESINEPSNLDPVLQPLLRPLLKRAWERRVRINQIRVALSNLYPDWSQGELFDERSQRQRELYRIKDALSAQFGGTALQPASQLSGPRT
jgi:DNA polymerase-4